MSEKDLYTMHKKELESELKYLDEVHKLKNSIIRSQWAILLSTLFMICLWLLLTIIS